MDGASFYWGWIWFLVFATSLTLHQAAHLVMARRVGYSETSGVSFLNPLTHLFREPVGLLAVPLLSFISNGFMIGWPRPLLEPGQVIEQPRRTGRVAWAGPVSHVILALLAAATLKIGLLTGLFHVPQDPDFQRVAIAATSGRAMENAAAFLSVSFSLNAAHALFQLIPFPPMDGSGAAAAFLSEERGRKWLGWTYRNPFLSMGGFLVCWFAFPFAFKPLHQLLLKILYLPI